VAKDAEYFPRRYMTHIETEGEVDETAEGEDVEQGVGPVGKEGQRYDHP
jgi:hypothetical protein